MINLIFQIDKKYWGIEQSDIIHEFFQFNSFFSKFYQNQHF
jgi:hypothetical protein